MRTQPVRLVWQEKEVVPYEKVIGEVLQSLHGVINALRARLEDVADLREAAEWCLAPIRPGVRMQCFLPGGNGRTVTHLRQRGCYFQEEHQELSQSICELLVVSCADLVSQKEDLPMGLFEELLYRIEKLARLVLTQPGEPNG